MKVSIITITYNRAHLIGETIKSVLEQTYQDFEHIIIDDGSTDDTEQVVKNFNDSRIRYYQYPKKNPRSFLRNEGIRKATGELISVLDSDDIWAANKLETITNIFIENPDVDFAFHDLAYIRKGEIIKDSLFGYENGIVKSAFDDLLDGKLLPLSIWTLRKTALYDIGLLDETLIDGQHDLYFRAAAKHSFFYCKKKLARIRKHDGNTSTLTDMRHYTDHLQAIDKLYKNGDVNQNQVIEVKKRIYRKMASEFVQLKKYLSATKYYLKAVF